VKFVAKMIAERKGVPLTSPEAATA